MRKLSYLQVGLACLLAFVLAWAPALAQDAGSLPQVDWPSESRFVTSMAEAQAPPQLMVVAWPCESRFGAMTPDTIAHTQTPAADAWPCEARYVALMPVAVAQTTPVASVDWPCEARFVVGSEHGPVMAATEWPCEARFVALGPLAPVPMTDALAQVDWPSETRFDPQLALAVYIGPAEPTLAMTAMEANKLLHRTPLQAFFLGDDPSAMSEVYPEELALARAAEWRSWQAAFSELEATLDFQVAEGDRVVSCWTFSGTQTGEFMGMAPTGEPMTFQVLYAAQFSDGHIVTEMGQLDLQTFHSGPDADAGPQSS